MTSINIVYDYDEDYNTNWSNYEWWQKQRSGSNRESLSNDYEKKSLSCDDVFSGYESKSSSKSDLSSVCDDDKRVETWSQTFVKDWIFQTCYEHSLPQPYPVKKFIMNGRGLLLLTKEDFINRSPECGDILYQRLQRLINNSDSFPASSTSSFNIGSEYQEKKQLGTYIPITIETPQHNHLLQQPHQQKQQYQSKQQQTTYPLVVKHETNNQLVEETILKETTNKYSKRRSNSGDSTSSNKSSNSDKNDKNERKRKKKHSKHRNYYDYELDYLNDMDNNMYDYLKYLNNYFLSYNYNPFSMFNEMPKYGFGIKSTKIVYQSAAKDICMYVNNNSLVVAA